MQIVWTYIHVVGRLSDVAAAGHDDHGYDADHQNDLCGVYVDGLHGDLLQCLHVAALCKQISDDYQV